MPECYVRKCDKKVKREISISSIGEWHFCDEHFDKAKAIIIEATREFLDVFERVSCKLRNIGHEERG